ncbi:hypothetical protein GCM10007205_24240 [Oxalicibacterium flavum]|uniref:Acetyltransferase n=1 Tax=Oxalicibacterium flavum TaxID=179467 RepID=A0A8J2XVF9_9BURK|nr:CatB-related O-acetyltransferase [Oxalicibacterium flavum]GGC14547.1 hypothetical protein GCM10007205_24240 [Oxalicibacterium flavum]
MKPAVIASSKLPFPLTVAVTPAWLEKLREVGISTDSSIENHDGNGGWLSKLSEYTFGRRIVVEGPCAFHGGLYGPNPWTAEGGFCTMGAASYSHSSLPEGLSVGRYCSIGKGLRFLDFAHPTDWVSTSVAFFQPSGVKATTSIHSLIERELAANAAPSRRVFDPRLGKTYPTIGHDVWIGENVVLSMGISVGTGAILASNAVVTRDVPPYTIVAGVPAKVQRMRFSEKVIQRLLKSHWWEYSFADLQAMNMQAPIEFLGQLEATIANHEIDVWQPRTLTFPDDLIGKD